jgi:hypothetical protein
MVLRGSTGIQTPLNQPFARGKRTRLHKSVNRPFLLAYGVGFAVHGYRKSPLEAMAYSLQQKFYEGFYRQRLKEYIEEQTDLAWLEVDRLRAQLGGSRGG